MSNKKCHLLLGTDLFDRKKNIKEAKRLIENHIGSIVSQSKVMETSPIGFTSDTMFLNQIIIVETKLSPVLLLRAVKKIEQKMGRIYLEPKIGEKYTSRIIDIDILKYNKIVYNTADLKIPHPQTIERKFVSKLYNKLDLV